MYFVYVLRSLKDKNLYTGLAQDLERRLSEHKEGISKATYYRRPFELIYYEACRNFKDAMHRERYLKTTYGKRYLRNSVKHDL